MTRVNLALCLKNQLQSRCLERESLDILVKFCLCLPVMKNWPKPCLKVQSNPVSIKVCRNSLPVVFSASRMFSRGWSPPVARMWEPEVMHLTQYQFSFHHINLHFNITVSLTFKGQDYENALNLHIFLKKNHDSKAMSIADPI